MKICLVCKVEKSKDEFPSDKRRTDGLNPLCKTCNTMHWKEWKAKNPEKYKSGYKDWYEKNKHGDKFKKKRKNEALRSKYGITLDDYNKLLEH